MTPTAVDPQRLRRLRALFDDCIELPAATRRAHLDQATRDDPSLVAEVLALVAAEERAAGLEPERVHAHIDASLRQLLPDAVVPGMVVGAYTLEAEIGSGGMGRVFSAHRSDPGIDQRVAIKLVRREVLGASALQRFRAEQALLARLRHPGICQFLDTGTLADDVPYFVMELLDGAEPLLVFADRHALPLDARIALFRKVLAAVQYAHQSLVVHRDLKNSNVLVLPDGQPKLVDFGIAKSIAESVVDARTATAERFLSLASAAPEQLGGGPVGVGCDVYSLGILLYELLSGRPPFDAATSSIPELIERIVHQAPVSMATAAQALDDAALTARHLSRRHLGRSLSGDLGDIVLRCLRKSPGERYPSVEALDADLERLQQGLPISLRGSDRVYRLRRFVARHRLAVALGAALALSLVAAAWIVSLQNIRIRAERDQAEQALAILREAFLSADPARMGGELVSASDLLRATLPQLEAHRAQQPLAFATLAATIAEVMLELGLSAEADEVLDRVVAVQAQTPLPEDLRARVGILKARSLVAASALDEADAWLGAEPPAAPELRTSWLIERGRWLVRSGRVEDALAVLGQASATRSESAADDALLAAGRRAEVDALLRLDRLADADATLALLERHQSALPPLHTQHLLTRMLRIVILRRQGRHDDALALARQVQEGLESDFGTDSPISARGRVLVGNLQLVRGDARAALAEYEAAWKTQRSRLGESHPETLRTHVNRLEAMQALAAPRTVLDREYEQLYRHAVARHGAAATFTAFVLRLWAESLLAAAEPQRAAELLRSQRAGTALSQASESERNAHRKLLARLP
ncbi:MAG: protein kinase [Xanthomonadales bacterium]|nr:protein kinase [Xanthomonadales bacterium]